MQPWHAWSAGTTHLILLINTSNVLGSQPVSSNADGCWSLYAAAKQCDTLFTCSPALVCQTDR